MSTKSNIPLFFISFAFSVLVINGHNIPAGGTVFDITKYGAQPNGDATKGLLAAWNAACASATPGKVLVPAGTYRLGPIILIGPCKAKTSIEILGNFQAPADPKEFNTADSWVKIERIDGLTVTAAKGAGVFDGQGQLAWKSNECTKRFECHDLPYLLQCINDSRLLSPLHDINITAPADSPNTDGIHIGRSQGVKVTRFNIATGDDCVSFGDGAKNVLVEQVTCGPGHGISVGSLGRYPNELPVFGLTIRNCTIKNTDNGVRIKTWHNSYEAVVSSLHFEDIVVENVTTPIIVDQEYCPKLIMA